MSKRVIVMHNNGDREERETERERETGNNEKF